MSDDGLLRARSAQASWMRGLGYARRGQWQQAIRALRAAIDEDPGHIEAMRELAACLAASGNGREAVRWIDQALSFERLDDGTRVRLLRLLGKTCMQGGDYRRAADAYQEALEISGHTGGPILNQLAAVMCKSGNFDRGYDLFFRAMRGYPVGRPTPKPADPAVLGSQASSPQLWPSIKMSG